MNYPICFYLAISIAVTILFPPERLLLYLCLPFGYDGLAVLDVVAVFFVFCHSSIVSVLGGFSIPPCPKKENSGYQVSAYWP